MRVFVTALDAGSLAGAGRRLGRSPAAVTRAIAFLENYVGTPLLHRTTRTIKLSEAGERYAAACRRVLTDLEEADMLAAGESAAPRGVLNVTGPVASGAIILRPILDAYLDAYPAVKARLLLLDRKLNMVEEGQDVALRIGHLPDSSLIAIRIGEVRQVICAAPSYLAAKPPIRRTGGFQRAPDHRLDDVRAGQLELRADRRNRRYPAGADRAAPDRQHGRGRRRLSGRRQWPDPPVLVSGRDRGARRQAGRGAAAKRNRRHCRCISSRRRGAWRCRRCARSWISPCRD